MPSAHTIIQVAVPVPLRQHFDYKLPADLDSPEAGCRVRVPFGRRQLVGVVMGISDSTAVEPERLKSIIEVIDATPILDDAMLGLLRWASGYYQSPLGEVIQAALPVALRHGAEARVSGPWVWSPNPEIGPHKLEALNRAPLQRKILQALFHSNKGLGVTELNAISSGWRSAMTALEGKSWVSKTEQACLQKIIAIPDTPPVPTEHQRQASTTILEKLGRYGCFLLHGVTGSGKTEVYLRIIGEVLQRGQQALVLVPEIGLTPQLVDRFRRRFAVPIAVLHSGLSDQERLCAWLMAASGDAPLVLGTRSAVFTPLARPGVIIIDEEHDGSFKQQEGFRYHARDLAVVRAHREQIPVVLGSATPSLESLHNSQCQRFQLLQLPQRAGNAQLPEVHLLDLRGLPIEEGISHPLKKALAACLERGEQSLLFLNRRGFAPVLMCYDCGWLAPCNRCDARLTLHKARGRLRCHHCGSDTPLISHCGSCASENLHPIGEGTQRLEDTLVARFPHARILRVDRDSTSGKGTLEEILRRIHNGEADILIGTQMLSKGHDFPNVTLVGVINADQGLYGLDFRAGEYLFQRIMQVAGRAGRSDKPGQVLIQTHHPDNPYLQALKNHDYAAFARFALHERQQTELAPYSHLVLLRAESPRSHAPLNFLHTAQQHAKKLLDQTQLPVQVMMAVASPMERRAGRYRAQLLMQSTTRPALRQFLGALLPELEKLRLSRTVRWSVDVDPMDMF
ncbi:MAG TPA: primosomal protein N' [Acidiferrobacteraceae bacterium]|nr:primosomal protein N' [Acidiferrobacteraceae bacterium]